MVTSSPRIAVAQMRMHWRLEENAALVLNHLTQAADLGAALVLFPELALTGFHAQVRQEADALALDHALGRVRAACSRLGVACAIGAPRHQAGGRSLPPFNSQWLIDEQGHVASVVDKAGLTPSEATYFAPGTGRPHAVLGGLRCSVLLCREVEDPAPWQQCPPGSLDLLLWPSIVTQRPQPPDIQYLPLAQALARHSAAHLVQCNWPHALNTPEGRGLGGSHVLGPDGTLLFSLPDDEVGLAVFTLGSTEVSWCPGPPRPWRGDPGAAYPRAGNSPCGFQNSTAAISR